jgi:hypothetical protein
MKRGRRWGRTWSVLRHDLRSPSATSASIVKFFASAPNPSSSQIVRRRLTSITFVGGVNRMIRARGRRGRRTGAYLRVVSASVDGRRGGGRAYRSLQMQMIGRRSGRSFFPLPLYFLNELPSITSFTSVLIKLYRPLDVSSDPHTERGRICTVSPPPPAPSISSIMTQVGRLPSNPAFVVNARLSRALRIRSSTILPERSSEALTSRTW